MEAPLSTQLPIQFIFISTKPDNIVDLKALIPTRTGCFGVGSLGTITYPLVFRNENDWQDYVDEYDGYGGDDYPSWPGVAIIDQQGKFYAVQAYPYGGYNLHAELDWIMRKISEL